MPGQVEGREDPGEKQKGREEGGMQTCAPHPEFLQGRKALQENGKSARGSFSGPAGVECMWGEAEPSTIAFHMCERQL